MRWLILDRPVHKNAIPADGWEALRAAFADFDASSQRVLVVTGAAGDFCAGADLDPEGVADLQGAVARHRRMKAVGAAAMTLHRLTKPTIAAVDGVAVGAGMNLALGCDVVVATTRARFSELFVRRGLTVDFGGTWLLPRVVGLQRAKELALSGRMVEAEEALQLGLCVEVVAPEELEDRVAQIAGSFLEAAPLAQTFTKQSINSAIDIDLAGALAFEGQAQAICLGTDDFLEGVSSFFERRSPLWKGR